MYKVGGKIAADGTGIATFTDWYGGKYEMWDGIPWNAVMSMREGVRVALKSDSNDHIRRLNQEAGKMVHYGGATEDEAITMITLNPAWIMGIDDKTGSLDVGKDGDVVIWNVDPLSTYARAEKVYIDGDLFFDSSLPGFGTTHFSGVMHGSGFGAGEDETTNRERTDAEGLFFGPICCNSDGWGLSAFWFCGGGGVVGAGADGGYYSRAGDDCHYRWEAVDGYARGYRERCGVDRGREDCGGWSGCFGEGAQGSDDRRCEGDDGLSRADRFGDTAGAVGDCIGPVTNDTVEPSDEIFPQMHVYDAFHSESEHIPITRFNGITNAIVAPADYGHDSRGRTVLFSLRGAIATRC